MRSRGFFAKPLRGKRMRSTQLWKGALMFCAAVLVLSALSGETRGAEMANTGSGEGVSDEVKALLFTKIQTANTWRALAASDIDKAMGSCATGACTAKWREEVIDRFFVKSRMRLHDFFSSAMVLAGNADEKSAVVAFYNPWSDALLLTQMSGPPTRLVIEDFYFVSGESWRGEKIETDDDMFGWFKRDDTVTMSVAKVYSKSVELFDKRFGPVGDGPFLPEDLKANLREQVEELAPITLRMITRMDMFAKLFAEENWEVLKKINAVMEAISEGGELGGALADVQDATSLEAVKALPQAVRSSLAPNFFMLKDNFATVALVSSQAPRWFVRLDIDLEKEEGQQITIQLFDLQLSREFVEMAEGGAE